MDTFLDVNQLSEESIEQKKKFEELLKKQDEERALFKEQKKIKDELTKDPRERMLNIQKDFKASMEALNKQIQSFDKKSGNIDDLFTPFNELKTYFVNSNYALTTFDKQLYKEQLEKVEKTLFQVRDILKPRKKFQFSKRQKQVQKENKQSPEEQKQVDFTLSIAGYDGKENAEIRPSREELKSTYKLMNLKNCQVYLDNKFETVYINNLENCKVHIGPVKSAVFVDKCVNCDIQISGHQLRIHNSKLTTFRIFSATKCIIEHCTELVFTPYSYKYPELEADFKDSGYSDKPNLWQDIQDFNWLKQEKSPNFELREI